MSRIPGLTVELAPVYRCGFGGRRFLTRRAAYRRAASDAYWAKHGEAIGPIEDAPPFGWGCDETLPGGKEHAGRIIPRLARWLRWRDGRLAAMRGGS